MRASNVLMAAAVCSAVFFFNYTQAFVRNVTNEVIFFKSLSDKYDMRIRPQNYPGEGVLTVKYDVEFIFLGPLDSTLMELDLSFFIRAEWQDERLQFPRTTGGHEDYITLDSNSLNQMWLPHLYISSGVEYTEYSRFDRLGNVYPNGTVVYSQRVLQKIKCFMNLHNFPHDMQVCYLKLAQFSYNEKQVKIGWKGGKFTKESKTYEKLYPLPQQYLADFSVTGYARDVYSEGFSKTGAFSTGTFSGVSTSIIVKREIVFYVVTVYIPSGLIVILSWAAFWVPYEESDARVTVGLIPVLTITEVIQYSKSMMPKVNYLMAIDYWLFAHLLFVVASFMEYVFTNVLISQLQYIHKTLHEQLERKEIKEAEQRILAEQAVEDRKRYEDMKKELKGDTDEVNMFAMMGPRKPEKSPKQKLKPVIKMLNVNADTATKPTVTSIDKSKSPHSDQERQKQLHGVFLMPVATNKWLKYHPSQGTKAPSLDDKGGDNLSEEPPSDWRSLAKRKKQKPKKSRGSRFINQMANVITDVDLSGRRFENKIDRGSRVVFPVVYLIFNIVYWCIELSTDEESHKHLN